MRGRVRTLPHGHGANTQGPRRESDAARLQLGGHAPGNKHTLVLLGTEAQEVTSRARGCSTDAPGQKPGTLQRHRWPPSRTAGRRGAAQGERKGKFLPTFSRPSENQFPSSAGCLLTHKPNFLHLSDSGAHTHTQVSERPRLGAHAAQNPIPLVFLSPRAPSRSRLVLQSCAPTHDAIPQGYIEMIQACRPHSSLSTHS